MLIEDIKNLLNKRFGSGSVLDIVDFSECCGGKFIITVKSSEFIGKSYVEQHRLVYNALGNVFDGNNLHALQINIVED
jgi:stress-induced morphogen